MITTFTRAGEYSLEIRDVTSRNGGSRFRYRVLLRPQIPHVGRIEIARTFTRNRLGSLEKQGEIDHLNLEPGQSTKISILTEREEGFGGEIALSLEGLPAGVQAFAATEASPDRPRLLDEGKKEIYRAAYQTIALVISVSEDAPPTRLPCAARLEARAVSDGHRGPALPVRTIPVMVVAPTKTVALTKAGTP